ncbi:MAG: hypothetical protein GEU98_17735 [Pseudonocardiaceae bacterium]|nr:hypothetical protein [Pseudonocardiaceae bacterium]
MNGKHHRPPREQGGFRNLPPRPDPKTGEPLPPHAPGFRRTDGEPHDDPARETRLWYKPKPPHDFGPVLAWHRENVKGKIFDFLIAVGMLIVGFGLISLYNGDGLAMITTWWMWLIILGGACLMSSPFTFTVTSAGSDWVKREYIRPGRRTRSSFVKLYELSEIVGSSGTGTLFLGLDDGERGLNLTTDDWKQDRRIWDLVYNGILHSVANGAEINKLAIQMLHLDQTPALDLARRPPEPNDG